MFGRLLPKNHLFFDLFEEHIKITVQASHTLLELVLTDQISLREDINPIKLFESQADEVAHRCIDMLHKSFITPLQSNDIFRLISRLDDVMDSIDEVFEDCLIYRISSFTPYAKEMVRLLALATEKLEVSVKGIRNRKKQAAIMREMNREIHAIENETDKILHRALEQLFDEEQEIRLLIKWKDIYEALEEAVDHCEDVSNIIDGIVMEYD